ncbi:MAG: phosphoglycerate kinase [Thermofilaceae archaeon]|nr:phosphoglycerate kinase [Thermofilaceae archaeon]MDW8004644.1 phosphoglycerate kinase [Thermofilaceae archaeon]
MLEEYGIKTLDDVNVSGKRVFVRVDINSPIDPSSKKILDDSRIREHTEQTLRELVSKRAKVVVIAHQGRKGDPDFTSLKEHAEIMGRILGVKVKFVDEIFGSRAQEAIKALHDGEVLVLENVRMWDGETKSAKAEDHAKSELVRSLASYVDVFVVDAFAAAHRPHASLVGFMPVAKHVVAGRVLEKELRALAKVRSKPERPCVYILGGAKAEDAADISEAVLSQGIADYVLTGGLVANLFLAAKNRDLGRPNVRVLEEKGFIELLPRFKEVLDKFGDKIILPVDLAVDFNGTRKEITVESLPTDYLIKDIGTKTIDKYEAIIKRAKSLVMNGPMGVFEIDAFAEATKRTFEAIASSKAFSVIGGGHTIAAAAKLGYMQRVSHVSTGGGALMEFLSKGSLPVVEELKRFSK